MATRVIVNPAEMQRLLRSPNGEVARHVLRVGARVHGRARRYVGVDTGRLRSSIYLQQVMTASGPGARIGSNVSYARYHHGPPRVRYIRPRRAKMLVFKPKGSNVVVFAKQVRAFEGTRFLERALREEMRTAVG